MHADLIVKNAKLYTVDANYSISEAFAVKNEKIVAVGLYDDIENLYGKETVTLDAEGKTVLPGFIDAHSHLLSLEGKNLLQVDCSSEKVQSINDIIQGLNEKADKTPPGKWVLGGRYDDMKIIEKRHPTRWDLDKASIKHPIHLRHVSGHLGVVNSKALEIAGISKNTDNPEGGTFDRSTNGEMTGVCREEADFLFIPGIGKGGSFITPFTEEEELYALKLSCAEYNKLGITSVGDALVGPSEIKTFQQALNMGKLSVRVYMMILDSYLKDLKELNLFTGFGNDYLKVGSIKSFVDGAIAGRTAWISKPYNGRPDDFGIRTKTPEEIEKIVFDAHTAGFQIAIHANGDKAIEMVLDAYEKVLKAYPRDNHRHRIAHCTVVTPKILERIRKLGVVVLPFSTYIFQHGEKMEEYGDRISMMFAHRSFLDYGIPIGGSSDNPCATQDPLTALYSMVTRKSSSGTVLGPEQKLSVEEAIKIYTMGSAYASFDEKIKGSLEVGKLGDFVVLSDDPHQVDPEALRDIRVEKTYVGGKEVFSL
jgi:hypothetical protein